jgi:hypothetical protein
MEMLPYIISPAIKERFRPGIALMFDSEDHCKIAAQYMLQRAKLLKDNCAIAAGNLRIAQHRDTLRYRVIRGGMYRVPVIRFAVDDYVHVKRRTAGKALEPEAKPGFYRVKEVRETGVLVLSGRCGTTSAHA